MQNLVTKLGGVETPRLLREHYLPKYEAYSVSDKLVRKTLFYSVADICELFGENRNIPTIIKLF